MMRPNAALVLVVVLALGCGSDPEPAPMDGTSTGDASSSSTAPASTSSSTTAVAEESSTTAADPGMTIDPHPDCEMPGDGMIGFEFTLDGNDPLMEPAPLDFILNLICVANVVDDGNGIEANCPDAKGTPHALVLSTTGVELAIELDVDELVFFSIEAVDGPDTVAVGDFGYAFEVHRGNTIDAPLIVAGGRGSFVPEEWFPAGFDAIPSGPEPCPVDGPTFVDDEACTFRQHRTLAFDFAGVISDVLGGAAFEMGELSIHVGVVEDTYVVTELADEYPDCVPAPVPPAVFSFLARGPA